MLSNADLWKKLKEEKCITTGQHFPFSLLCQQPRSLSWRPRRSRTDWEKLQEVRLQAGQSNIFVSKDCLGTKCTVSAQTKANYTGTMFKTLFYLKTCNQCFREQMAGVFTLNMKLIQSCICEALGSFITDFAGVLSSVISYYHVIRLFLNPYHSPNPYSFHTFSTSMCHLVFYLDKPLLRSTQWMFFLSSPIPQW